MSNRSIERQGNDRAALSVLEQDNRVEEQNSRLNKQVLLPLERIQSRPSGDTRTLKPVHVTELKNSIAVLGLITPLAVDSKYRLLAGGHRRAALQELKQEDPERFQELFPNGVPVLVFAVDSEISPVEALQLEIEENTQRRNYSASEIRAAAKKLEEAGYEQLRGRPKLGQKSLNRELQNVFRLTERRIRTILNPPDQKGGTCSAFLKDLQAATTYLERLSKKVGISSTNDERKQIQQNITRLMKSLKQAIDQEGQRQASEAEAPTEAIAAIKAEPDETALPSAPADSPDLGELPS